MKSSNRLLLGFGIGIVVLVLITLGVVLTWGNRASPSLPENTPEGTVQRYLLALKDGDYARAQTYIAVQDYTKTPLPVMPPPRVYPENQPGWKATLGKATVNGDQATVEVIVDVFRGPSGPFDNPVSTNHVIFTLQNQSGRWLISSPFDAYWLW